MNCLLPLIKPPQQAFLTNFLQQLLSYYIWSQSIIQKSKTCQIVILPFLPCSAPEIHVPFCFQTTVIPELSLEIKAREKMTSKSACYVLNEDCSFKAKEAMKHLTSVTASHQNPVLLDHICIYQDTSVPSLDEEEWFRKKNSVWETSGLTTLKHMKT